MCVHIDLYGEGVETSVVSFLRSSLTRFLPIGWKSILSSGREYFRGAKREEIK